MDNIDWKPKLYVFWLTNLPKLKKHIVIQNLVVKVLQTESNKEDIHYTYVYISGFYIILIIHLGDFIYIYLELLFVSIEMLSIFLSFLLSFSMVYSTQTRTSLEILLCSIEFI